MTINGQITRTDDDALIGWIASLTFDVDIVLTQNPHKSKDSHPDYEITAKTPRNRIIRIGSGWEAESRAGNKYISLAINDNGQNIRANALRADEDPEGEYRIVPLSA